MESICADDEVIEIAIATKERLKTVFAPASMPSTSAMVMIARKETYRKFTEIKAFKPVNVLAQNFEKYAFWARGFN